MSIAENLASIRARMAAAAQRAGRSPESVTLVAVSKIMPVATIAEAVGAGQLLFGENYLQEAEEKIRQLPSTLKWHFIGHLQSNKAKTAATLFHMVETVDRIKLARMLDKHAAEAGRVLPVLVQVNVGREPQKAGVLPEEAEQLLREIQDLPHLAVRGLMTMPPFFDQPERARPSFRALRVLSEELAVKGLLGSHGPIELSMGMSGDFEVAIEEGATLVRVGTALFGARN
ncbi:MAG TPA: YggS family pyridoxal phosphate-dependent enzyme [Desulfurivibrionaceae bacterium]|nr:YggS family pyridoxal phosphate-dependent enzyme [Desulfurivibrionaceae bacterium]